MHFSDTLVRHRALHERPSWTRPRRRRGQACASCSRLKQSCDGGQPCSRCQVKEKECVYSSGKPAAVGDADDGQAPSVSSPVADVPDETVMSGDLQTALDEWHNPQSVSSDTSGMRTIASGTIYASVRDTHCEWDRPRALPAQHPFDGDMGALDTMSDSTWTPWNTLVANLSVPWFTDGFGVPMDFADLPDLVNPPQTLMHNAPAPPETAPAPISNGIRPSSAPVSRQTYISPQNICSSHTRPCEPFPETQALTLERAGAEVFGHVHRIPQQAIQGLNDFYRTQMGDVPLIILPYDIVHAFVELYFEYFDSQFPFLHPSRLEDPDLPFLLLLATAAVGSHYSEIPGAERYNLILCDLLARAAEPAVRFPTAATCHELTWRNQVSNHILNVDTHTMQSVFLLHVLWMFSRSHRDKLVLQHRGSSLATMCRDLLGRADKRHHSSQSGLDGEEEWQAWLTKESELRLATCVQVLECLCHTFLGTTLLLNLREATRQLPCPERMWKSRDAADWKARREIPSDSQCGSAAQKEPSRLDTFTCKVILLDLYVEEKSISRQIRTSQLLHSSLTAYLSTTDGLLPESPRMDPRRDTTLLDKAVSDFTFARLGGGPVSDDTLFHAIAILRIVPLESLNSATGWQTTKEQRSQSKMYFKDFFHNHGPKARKGLWHSACIFKLTRGSRRLVCYDVLCITVAMSYIYCYCEARTSLLPTSARPQILRLDQIQERAAVEDWIQKGADSVVHLTGVGLLDGDDACVRFLRDLERGLANQIAWHGFCRAFASSFAQLRRGEIPTKHIKD
ncbi:hypothetical protein BFJ72_g7443 [Fusarium proliferatum]|uniref:Zn(2)-C6 fungal-type domain-containing protein n=1 Tax=Gibberella intermedia TaxID=948311 RepID=A0A420T8X2_GIBIN|nr:hypothetical protein BFJ72_g7443 [Fusarium proliferatum]